MKHIITTNKNMNLTKNHKKIIINQQQSNESHQQFNDNKIIQWKFLMLRLILNLKLAIQKCSSQGIK